MKMIKSVVEVQITVYTPYRKNWEDDSDTVWYKAAMYFKPNALENVVLFNILEQGVVEDE